MCEPIVGPWRSVPFRGADGDAGVEEVEAEAHMAYTELAQKARAGDMVVLHTEDEVGNDSSRPAHHGYHLFRLKCTAETAQKKLTCPQHQHTTFEAGDVYLRGTYMELDPSHSRNSSDAHVYSTAKGPEVYVPAEAVRYVLDGTDIDWSLVIPRKYRQDLVEKARGSVWQPVLLRRAVHECIISALSKD